MNARIPNGWQRLPNGYDVEFRHGIPVRLSDNGKAGAITEPALCEEITRLGGLPVALGAWTAGEGQGEREAPLFVAADGFAEVLRRLARASAAVFVDRFHKPVDAGDVDWDRLEYLKDFSMALAHCRLAAGEVDQDACYDDYVETMHAEAQRLAQARTPPPVEPE
jgi:hypothetical protein